VKHNNQLITAGTIATGVAGTPSSQYLSVQGGVGMTPVITNSTQLNGVAFLAGNGATGTGSPRVTIANDNSPIATQPAIGTAKYLHQVISIASSGQNTVIARTIGTIKVYALELSCASTVTTADPRNGASTSLGAMSNFNSTFKWLNGEPVFSTTGTNDFTINLSSAVACTGWAKYIDS
jgi:hypothetical protein